MSTINHLRMTVVKFTMHAVHWNHLAVSMNKQHSKPGHLRCKHKYANV